MSTIPTNTSDTYSHNWLGLRPPGPNELINYNHTVTNHNTDGVAEAFLSAKIYSLQTGSTDQVRLNFILTSNSRQGIAYTLIGPTSLPWSYGINTATDSGIHCSSSGTWVNLPGYMAFYGYPGLSGYYNKIWISANGYVSVLGDANAGSLSPGVIAAFSRPLNPCAGGHIYFWNGGSSDFYVAWDKVPTVANGNLESFFIWIHDPANGSVSPFGQTGIEFWYNSITPNDLVPTAIGIEDQYGERSVTAASNWLSNNQRLQFQATSGPKYLNSLSVTLSDTSNGVLDQNAQVVLDPSLSPVGYNVIQQTTPPGLVLMPDYAETAYGWGSLLIGLGSATAGDLLGGVPLAASTYNLMVNSFWASKLASSYNQAGFGDPTPASLKVVAAQDGVAIPPYTPLDASISAKLLWTFKDVNPRNMPHHLSIQATIGYTDSQFQGYSDKYTISTDVQLDVNPDYKLGTANFENGNGSVAPFVASDSTNTPTWVATGTCPPFVNGGTTVPNCVQGSYLGWSQYFTYMDSQLVWNLGNLINYNQIVLYAHVWEDLADQVSVDYLSSSGAWTTVAIFNNQLSTTIPRSNTQYTAWINPRIVFPGTATAIRFRFQTGSYVFPSLKGFYLDDLYLFGDGPGGSADVFVNSQLQLPDKTLGGPLAAPMSADNGPFYSTPDHFLLAQGSHTITVQNKYTDNTGTYSFSQWSDGATITTRTVSLSSSLSPTPLTALYSAIPDFAVSANPTSLSLLQGVSGNSAVSVVSRNGFTGTVALSLSVSPATGLTCGLTTTSVTLGTSGSSTLSCSGSAGFYTATVAGSGGGLSSSAKVAVTVSSSCSCGGGGSVAAGTMVTLANGTLIRVENLQVGMRILSYNMTTRQFVNTTITTFSSVVTDNFMVIMTTTNVPLVTDQNPAQTLYVMFPNATWTLLPVTKLKVGYYLFNMPTLSWVQITNLYYHTGGKYTMYDIYNTAPYDYVANGYLDPQKL